MVERFADAALRHLETAEVLEVEGRTDDAAYHYGLVGEMALKAAAARAIGLTTLPKLLHFHINQTDKNHNNKSLQTAIENWSQTLSTMRAGRLGGALGTELSQGLLGYRFVGWSLHIRYADDTCCPVGQTDLAIWKADALDLYNNGCSRMSPRYDDALPALIRVAQAAGIDLSAEDVVVLRDATGRLGIAFAKRRKSDGLAGKLREALEAYALAEPVLPSSMFQSINAADPRRIAVSMGDGEFAWVRLVDRRIVGADWLSDLAPPPEGPPRLVFGSLKGGVGRTTALAVLAADLAGHGRRVLCIDLDLEAPGLGSMLLRSDECDDRRPNFGALDYLVENGLGGIKDDELLDFIGVSHFSDGSVHVLPATGRVTDNHPENMIGKLARGLIEDVGPNGRQSVAAQMRQMVDRFVDYGDYDAVLVDARAGLAKITAGTWLGLGARKLLLFGTNQPQTFQGYRYVLSHLVQTLGVPDSADEGDWRARITFAHSKAPSAGDGRTRFREGLYELCAETLYEAEDEVGADWVFNFGLDEAGADVPHSATFVAYHPDYDAFAPLEEETLLHEDVYRGPFGTFLERAWLLLGWERSA